MKRVAIIVVFSVLIGGIRTSSGQTAAYVASNLENDVFRSASKKKKRRISPSLIFGALANSCAHLGQLAAFLGPEKQAAFNLFGVIFGAVAQATDKRKNKKNSDEIENQRILGGMTEDDFVANMMLLAEATGRMIEAQQMRSVSLVTPSDSAEFDSPALLEHVRRACDGILYSLIFLLDEWDNNMFNGDGNGEKATESVTSGAKGQPLL